MPKFAHFAPNGAILNWMDTDAFNYAEIPPQSELLEISDEQYDARGDMMVADGALVPYVAPAPTLAQLRAAKLAELSAACSSRMGAIKAGYPQDEISTWDKQESEAREFKRTGGTAPTPLLSALSAARGVTLADLADRVIAKADAFAAISGSIIGRRQKYEDQVAAATDAAGVAAVAWVD